MHSVECSIPRWTHLWSSCLHVSARGPNSFIEHVDAGDLDLDPAHLGAVVRDEEDLDVGCAENHQQVAARHGKSVAQLAISWVLGDPAVTVALVGIRRTEELKENVAAVEWRLSAEERQEIDTIFADEGVPTHAETSQITEPFLPAR